jgi:GNAT superfamily N-acetyltransferase
MPDRPGSLAALAAECGRADVNILGFQAFPDVARVTDELVLSTPDDWAAADLVGLLQGAGGEGVIVQRCTEAALTDQPTRYVQAARQVIAQPASFPDVVAHLFDADAAPASGYDRGDGGDGSDVMELSVAEVLVQIRRVAPFTAVEHARGASMAELVSDVLGRERPAFAPSGSRRMGSGATPTYAVRGDRVVATADGSTVGLAVLRPGAADEPLVRTLDIDVDPAWQRRGIGTRLLGDAARLARRLGAEEVVITTAHDNRAVLPMVLAAGMRGRIRMAGETLTVRIGLRELRAVPEDRMQA